MIAIVDYGMGNLRSVEKALEKVGHAPVVTADPAVLAGADRLILPGVGAFGAAMRHLEAPTAGGGTLADAVREFAASGRPLLGICLGMQLLLSESEELGRHAGLGLIPGEVVRFDNAAHPEVKVPHMGWNALRFPRPCPLFAGLREGAPVYFVHSFYCRPGDPEVTVAEGVHGEPFCAGLWSGNLYAAQFHPEKSGAAGLRILANFASL
jgi:glutamine amidotransferase